MTPGHMSKLLMAAGRSVVNTLTFFELSPQQYGFAILIWPTGQPERVSSMGGGNWEVQTELTVACAAASKKTDKPPRGVEIYTPPKEGNA